MMDSDSDDDLFLLASGSVEGHHDNQENSPRTPEQNEGEPPRRRRRVELPVDSSPESSSFRDCAVVLPRLRIHRLGSASDSDDSADPVVLPPPQQPTNAEGPPVPIPLSGTTGSSATGGSSLVLGNYVDSDSDDDSLDNMSFLGSDASDMDSVIYIDSDSEGHQDDGSFESYDPDSLSDVAVLHESGDEDEDGSSESSGDGDGAGSGSEAEVGGDQQPGWLNQRLVRRNAIVGELENAMEAPEVVTENLNNVLVIPGNSVSTAESANPAQAQPNEQNNSVAVVPANNNNIPVQPSPVLPPNLSK